jgi:plastocyanin
MGMNRRSAGMWMAATVAAVAWISQTNPTSVAAAAQAAGTGTIKGHVKLAGPAPANPIIRMGMDPLCARENQGKRLTQEVVVTGADGALANVLVQLEGSLPAGAPSKDPVVINQKGCVYVPHVVAAQAGQTLRIINSDTLVHNVHVKNSKVNTFDVTQPKSGMVFNYTLKKDDVVLKLGCMVHSWMSAYVGVSPNAFSAVTDKTGNFTIAKVPPGKYTVQFWHERYGKTTKTVTVTPGGTATVDFEYSGSAKPQASNEVRQLLIPS